MRSASYTGQFRRDVKRMQKRGKDMDRLRHIIIISLLLIPTVLCQDLSF